MSVRFPQSASTQRERVIKELVQGQEHATRLKFLFQNHNNPHGSTELVANVLRSFSESLSVLTSSSSEDENLLVNNSGEEVAGSTIDPRPEDSSESRKGSFPVTKDRRGSYKRRKTEQTWTTISQTTDDNHAWRKYGQKEILNSQYPRSYFRCTRKYDQGCRATKQVQRVQENPDMYQITYTGFHTCKDTLKAPQMVTYSETWDSFLVNSNSDSKVPNEQDPPNISQSPTVKQEYPNHDTQSDLTDANLWSDLKDFEISKSKHALKIASDNADTVYSCTGSQSLGMDFGVFSSHFSSDFNFDESHLL